MHHHKDCHPETSVELRPLACQALAALDTAPPDISLGHAAEVASRCYGLESKVQALSGERDRNFLARTPHGSGAILKFISSAETKAETESQVAVLRHLASREAGALTPRHLPSVNDDDVVTEAVAGAIAHRVRAYTFLEGRPASEVMGSATLRYSLGQAVAAIDTSLFDFHYPGLERVQLWNIMHLGELRSLTSTIVDVQMREMIDRFIDAFIHGIGPAVSKLRHQAIHNDLSKSNVLVGSDDTNRVAGIVDFGDLAYAPLVCDVAIASSYQIADSDDQIEALQEMLDGFESILPLEQGEREHVLDLVLARVVQRLVINHWRAARFPDNRGYILRHTAQARFLLGSLEPLWRAQSVHARPSAQVSVTTAFTAPAKVAG